MKNNRWFSLIPLLALTLVVIGCTNDNITEKDGKETKETVDTAEDTQSFETDPPETTVTVPDEWHVFEYDGVEYDFWDISELVNGVGEWGHIGEYIIAEGHVNPNMCIYAVIDTETKKFVHHFSGTVPTYHSNDINTLVYAYQNNVVAYDGTTLASFGLKNGEYIDSLSYTEDKSCIEVKIEGVQGTRRNIVNLTPFDAESFFGSIPAEWSQHLFWHQIRGTSDYMYFCNYRGANSTLDGLKKDPPTRFSIYHVNSKNLNVIGTVGAEIPSDISYDTVCPVVVMDGTDSMECEFIVQLTDGDKLFYVSFDNFDCGDAGDHLTFTCRGILSEERIDELNALYREEFLKAKQYYWHHTLDDFKNDNPGDSIVYEGYTVEYKCQSLYGDTFDFHIHLPQVNDDSIYVDKWNYYIKNEYGTEFGEHLQNTAYGMNLDVYVNVTYETVSTGDVITIYIMKSHGIMNSGAFVSVYDIFHYDTVQKKFLSTDEFIAYYAEGMFAYCTVADIVQYVNENVFCTDEAGNPYPLTEENIYGVIPSEGGNGKLDVVYRGYTMEGIYAIRRPLLPDSTTETLPEDFVFPVTDGSTSTTNLDKAVRNAIPGGEQTVAHTKTYTSFQNLLDKKCDLIFTTPLSESQLQTMEHVGFRHGTEPVAGEGVVFAVNKDNPVDTLTIEQIKGIYSGEITNQRRTIMQISVIFKSPQLFFLQQKTGIMLL